MSQSGDALTHHLLLLDTHFAQYKFYLRPLSITLCIRKSEEETFESVLKSCRFS